MTKTETVNDKSPTVETMSTIVQAALEHNEGKANLATIAKLATRTAGY